MPTFINILGCSGTNLNTGIPNCAYDWGEISQFILIPKGKSFTQTEVQTLYTTLTALNSNATEALRSYPIGKFTNLEDLSDKQGTTKNGYGGINIGRKPKPHWLMTFQNGGMAYNIALNSFHDKQDTFDVLVVDKSNNTIVGTTPDLNDSFYVLKGFTPEQLYSEMFKLNPESPAEYKFGVCFADVEEFMRLAYYKLPASQKVNNLVGLRNFEMSILPALVSIKTGTTALRLRITTDGGAIDLGSLYSSSWAALDTQFTVVGSNGTSYAISSGAYTTATGSVDMVIATLPAAGVDLTITSPTITQLVAAGISGFGNSTLVATVLAT